MNSNRKSPVSGDLISKKPNGKDNLSTIGEARARAWQVATPPVAIGQGMYISVFGAREPETGRILALKKARGSKRYMQDVNACVLN
ncbi:hypothetical protein YC2023_063034 [Brassica napus]